MREPRNFVPEPFQYHQEVTLKIESLTNLGLGLGRVDGWVVMVPFALPGEAVRARVWRNHKNYSSADLLEVVEPSEQRVEPHCALFTVCGGCQYQHFTYEGQLEWKRQQVVELLNRLAGIQPPVNPTCPSPEQYGYRSKLTPHFQKPRDDKPLDIGFLRNDSRRIIDVPQCPIATDAINTALPVERAKVHERSKKYRKGGTLLLRDTLEGVVTESNAIVSQRVGKLVFQFQAGEFFQNNPFILPKMVEHVVNEARGEGIDWLVDAYCGAGVFCLSASSSFRRLAGVEISASSIHWANANAAINRIENCDFIIGKAEAVFEGIDFEPSATAVVVDPPRKGCDRAFLEQLFTFAPARVVYVSCDPATQARDLQSFLKQGYAVKCVQPFDLFPQTRHIENVVTLEHSS